MRALTRTLLVASVGTALLAPGATPGAAQVTAGARTDAVISWNANAGEAARAACIAPVDNPLHESRLYAMMHVAVHDALNAIDRRSQPYVWDARARGRTSPDAAVAAAARHVLVPLIRQIPAPFPPTCIKAGVARVEADYAAALRAVPPGRAKRRGVAIGKAAAAAILALRAHDGSDTPLVVSDYPQGTEPGEWRFTPDRPFAFAPGWGGVTPFVLADSAQYRPRPPYAVTTKKYAADFNEVKALGGDGQTTPSARTADQTEIALFWIESSPLRWNRIARTVSARRGLNMWQNARLFGLLNLALADGYISSFDTKYHYNYWRPVTAIRDARTDGNPRTQADATWTPLVTTPPIPDYDSAHAVEGGAAAGVLMRFFGGDHMRFAVCSLTLPPGRTCDDASPVLRRYTSFSQATRENAVSRVYVGWHFRFAAEQGDERGRKVGRRAFDRFLRPVAHHDAASGG